MREVAWFCPKWLHDFFVPRGCVTFLSQEVGCFLLSREVAWFFLTQKIAVFFCPKRLYEFFVPRGCMIFFVSRGCVIIFVPRSCMIFFCLKRLMDYFCPKMLHDFFCPRRLRDFFVLRFCVIIFDPRCSDEYKYSNIWLKWLSNFIRICIFICSFKTPKYIWIFICEFLELQIYLNNCSELYF